MKKLSIPDEYIVNGIEAVNYSKPDSKSEAVSYITPNGAKFTIAKDFMGIQICANGRFWPPPPLSFKSMEAAVKFLKENTSSAIAFFDEVQTKSEGRGNNYMIPYTSIPTFKLMCNNCKRVPASHESYDTAFIKAKGVCPECLEGSKGLIKVDDHYVPWVYRNHVDFNMETKELEEIPEDDPEYFDDVYAKLPKIEWCKKYKKYKVTFESPDIGGYDVATFEWYFDNKEDIIKSIFGKTPFPHRSTARDPKHSEYLS